MKNCWPFENNFEPLTEIIGIARIVGVRKVNVRRMSV
jgi:hypothetical protein